MSRLTLVTMNMPGHGSTASRRWSLQMPTLAWTRSRLSAIKPSILRQIDRRYRRFKLLTMFAFIKIGKAPTSARGVFADIDSILSFLFVSPPTSRCICVDRRTYRPPEILAYRLQGTKITVAQNVYSIGIPLWPQKN